MGVRFISVNDVYDSANPRCIGGLETAFKNLLIDLYSRDCSVKVRNGKRTTALQGKYQNPWAPFGYVKSVQERGKLGIDPNAAEIVRKIFALFLEGRGTVEVARTLNREGVPTKSAYRAEQGDKMRWQYAEERNFWNAAAVRGILTDKRYVGSVVYGKQRAKGVAAHRNIKAPQEQVVEVENCHEPLIARGDFDRAQAMLGEGKNYGKSARPLAGKIKCGVCGHAMPMRKGKEPYFTCGTKWYDLDYSCGDFRIGQKELYEVLAAALRRQVEPQVEQEILRRVEAEKIERKRTELEQELARLERAMAQNREQTRVNFERFAAGKLEAEEFAALQEQNKRQIAQQNAELAAIQRQIAEISRQMGKLGEISLTENMEGVIINNNIACTPPELLDELIREVRVWPDGMAEIVWGFDKL